VFLLVIVVIEHHAGLCEKIAILPDRRGS